MIRFLFVLTLILFLNACQATQDALTLKKKSSGDEFLVEKKSPLVLPPSYGELPLPNEENIKQVNENNDIKIAIGNEELEIEVPIKNSKPTSLEQSVLEKMQ